MIKNDLKRYRVEKGLTQQQLADLTNVRRETIVRLEKQLYNPSLELAIQIADTLKQDIREVFWIAE
ncbi:transcriptional regulator (plasmid) [Enterococcus gilvus]|jgi:putative transcriptional regulator|uniref:helix-turn-helix transcriptional regulator n=1 Tax=Enterococcus gilvus TaxID=160453 RepID=UPI000DF63592|nr:helix-turn-helix transcriptional regulator [Enterococcus gilvus]AXG40414.1 transcriptional regulator [Enterococcus gilvus]